MVNPNCPRPVPTFIGGDTQVLFNVEYRIPIFGPLAFAPFFDIGSVFNLRDLEDQFIQSEFVPNSFLGSVVLNPRGQVATRREIKQARTPENPGFLPPGFRFVSVQGRAAGHKDYQPGRSGQRHIRQLPLQPRRRAEGAGSGHQRPVPVDIRVEPERQGG